MDRRDVSLILFIMGLFLFNWPGISAVVGYVDHPNSALRLFGVWFAFIGAVAATMHFLRDRRGDK